MEAYSFNYNLDNGSKTLSFVFCRSYMEACSNYNSIDAKLYLLFFAALIWQPTTNYNLNNGRKTLSFALASSMLARFRKFHL
jgi:hypothetical protein